MSRRLISAVLVTILAGTFLVASRATGTDQRHLTATFARTTSLYEGARVKVLGVDVGRVDAITVKGTAVEVEISYDEDVKLPTDVHAMIVPPSIVGDRFVQLAPAYEDGPVLHDDARLGLDRTDVPLELDDTNRGIDKLAAAFGPRGANKDGALSRLVAALAANFDGNGRSFNTAMRTLADAMSTLSGSADDINGTITHLGRVTDNLAGNDNKIRALVVNLAQVGAQLNGQRNDITLSVKELRGALRAVADFAKAHRTALRNTVDRLTSVSGMLARRTRELEEMADIAPVGLTNLTNIYVPTNWDLRDVGAVPPGARTSSAAIRSTTFNDLDVSLGHALESVCAGLPAEQQARLAAFCTTLQDVGGSVGALATRTAYGDGPALLAPAPGATSLVGLLTGESR